MSFGILESILCVLLGALTISALFKRFKLPLVLGYFLVGVLMGPNALGLIPDLHEIQDIAEFGIVFLMFAIGLEFSQAKLFALKKAVFIIGGLQVLLSVLLTTGIGILLGMSLLSALVVGGIVAMSSTAIVVKQLKDQSELHTSHGLNAVGILLFQDLAVIPFIILIVGLSAKSQSSLAEIFLWALAKGVFAILLISFVGRWLLKPIFMLITRTRAAELFTLTVLLITLMAAWLTNVLGLSYALGAFLAGIMLSETEFRHQIEIEIRPFRDILLGLFFISIGMLADITQWDDYWVWIGLLLVALTVGKMLLIVLISRLTGSHRPTAIRTGLVLAQGGEFGFAILTLALAHNMLPEEYGQVILAALLISIATSPLLIYSNKKIAGWCCNRATHINDDLVQQDIFATTKGLKDHIIICGYGRVGQHVARVLDKAKFPYVGLDVDAELIKRANLAGEYAIYGDASHPGILKAAGLARAKALVISFDNLSPAIRVLALARRAHRNLPILVRCKDQDELMQLKKYGATKIVAEIFEESLTLSQYLLQEIQVPVKEVSALMAEVRNKDYDFLRRVFSGSFSDENGESFLHENLMPIWLPEEAYAVGRRLGDFDFESVGVEVIAVRRGKAKPLKPYLALKLQANDIVIVYGASASVDEAERLLLEG